MEGAIFAAEVADADLNLSTNDEVVTKLNFSSVRSHPSVERSIRDEEFTFTENISALTHSLCSFSGLRSAASTIAAELISNNNADESNVENNIPSSNNPHAPSKHRTKKRVFIALDNNNDDGVVSRISRGMRKVFVRPIRNRSLTLNGEGFNNTRDYKRLRTIYNPQQSNSTSNKLTNNATDKSSATDTTAAVEEEEVEFFTENGGFNNEEGDTLLGDGASGGALNEGDSIKEPMDISVGEESSPSTITSAVSNTGETESVVASDELELQSSHFNNTAASGESGGSSAGEGTLAVDIPTSVAEVKQWDIMALDVLDDSTTARRKSSRLNANTGEVVADRVGKRTSPSAVVINANAGIGTDGYAYMEHELKPIFREIIINPGDQGKITWQIGGGNTKCSHTQFHQLHLCVTAAFGASVYQECHYKSGGLLEGILEEGQTWNDRFDCPEGKCARKNSLVKEYGQKQMPNQCDGDHLFGRSELYLNGFLMVQQVPHRENLIRAWVRSRAGEWLYPLTFGAYKGGNPMPDEWKDRVL